jgi:hypothetical protein
MTNEPMKCPKCTGAMVQGFIPDYSHGAVLVAGWLQGHPQKSFWRTTKAPISEVIPIGTFRCEKCGFLEFYADPKFAAQ